MFVLKTHFCALAAATVLLLASPGFSQEQEATPQRRFDPVLDYIDQDIHLVGWLDTTQFDVAEVAQFMAAVVKEKTAEQSITAALDTMKAGLNSEGCKGFYLIGSLPELMTGGALLVFPCESPKTLQTFLESMPSPLPNMQFQVDGDVLLYGAKLRIDTAIKKKRSISAGLKHALSDPAADMPHGIVFAPPASFGDLMQFPVLMGTQSRPAALLPFLKSGNDLRWVMISGKLPPRDMAVIVDFKDAASAVKADRARQALLEEMPLDGSAEFIAYSVESNRWMKRIPDPEAAIQWLQEMRENELGPMDNEISNRLKQIGLALHNYYETYDQFPPQAVVDAAGNRLLSWRVLILPYLDQQALYDQFHLDEPWDSPHNLRLAQTIPEAYAPQTQGELKPGYTRVVAPLTADSAFGRPGKPLKFSDITDGTSNTIWFVEGPVAAAVPWSKPDDWEIDADSYQEWLPTKKDSAPAGYIDGSVRRITGAAPWEIVNKLLTVSGGEVVEEEDLNPQE